MKKWGGEEYYIILIATLKFATEVGSLQLITTIGLEFQLSSDVVFKQIIMWPA